MVPPATDARGDVNKDVIIIADPLPPDGGARDSADVPSGVDTRDGQRPEVDGPPPPFDARDLRADQSGIDGGAADTRDGAMERLIMDPPPIPVDARDLGTVVDMAPRDPGAYDARPVKDASLNEPFVVDPVALGREGLQVPTGLPAGEGTETAREHWALVTPTRLKRSQDLPLCLCPEATLAGEWRDGKVHARLRGPSGHFATRWQAQGEIEGEGTEVRWTPSSDEDQLDVAIRTADGVSVALLRLAQVAGRKKA